MSDVAVQKVQATAKTWRDEAQRRRQISKVDPVAETLDYCASELALVIEESKAEDETETVEEVAAREHVTPQTVRNWIRANLMPARRGGRGYLIPKGSTAPARKSA